MRVLLFVPNISKKMPWESAPEPPLGVASVAAYLEGDNEIKIIDNFLEKRPMEKVMEDIKKFKPDAIGMSMTSFTIEECLELAEMVKKWDDKVNVFVGGAHASLFPKKVLEFPCLDAVITGEGEYTARDYINALKENKKLSKIEGLGYKSNNEIKINPRGDYIKNLDELKFPAWHLLKIEGYPEFQISIHLTAPVMTMCSSRGCPYRCLYCSSPTIWGRSWRGMSGKRIVDEIEVLIKKYGIKSIKFHEDHFTLKRDRVMDFCDELKKRGVKIEWQCEARVNNVDFEMLKAMKEVGCKLIWFGIESGTQRILDFYRKDINLKQIKDAVEMAKKAGMKVMGSFIIGAPIETEEEMKKTIEFGLSLGLEEVYFNILFAIPGTDLYEYVTENELIHKKIGEIIEVGGTVPRARVEKLRRDAQKRIIIKKIKKKWKKFLIYYLTHPHKFFSNRVIRNVKFLLDIK